MLIQIGHTQCSQYEGKNSWKWSKSVPAPSVRPCSLYVLAHSKDCLQSLYPSDKTGNKVQKLNKYTAINKIGTAGSGFLGR